MPKAVAVINNVYAGQNGALRVSYTVSVNMQDGTSEAFSSDAPAGETSGLTLAQWKTAAQNKVISDCAGKGIIVNQLDVFILGGPM